MAKKPTPTRDWPKYLKRLRAKLGLKQTHAAARICVSPGYWSRMEAGHIVPPAPVAYLLELLDDGTI